MIIAVTGGTGFVGSKIVKKHLDAGDSVRVFTRRKLRGSASLSYYHGDLTTSTGGLGVFLKDVDTLYHCACEINNPALMESVNVDGTRRLIETAIGRVGRVVYLSSVGVYGKIMDGIVREETPFNPQNEYERTKARAEGIVKTFNNHVILRPSNVYGSGMGNQSLNQMISMIKRGLFFYIGEGAIANYVHVDDVARALYLCGTHPRAENKDYIVSDYAYMDDFVGKIAQLLGVKNPWLRFPEGPVRAITKHLERIPKFPLTLNRIDALTTKAVYTYARLAIELNYRHSTGIFKGLEGMV